MSLSKEELESVGDKLLMAQISIGHAWMRAGDVVEQAMAIIKLHADSLENGKQAVSPATEIPQVVECLLKLVSRLSNTPRVQLSMIDGKFSLSMRSDLHIGYYHGDTVRECLHKFSIGRICVREDIEFESLKSIV